MKLLFLLVLVGFASASVYDVLDDAAEEFHRDFVRGLSEGPSLKEALGLPHDAYFADEAEEDIKHELAEKLREVLKSLLEKIKDAIENGRVVTEDLKEKLEELKEKMKELKVSLPEEAKELIEKIREKAREFFKNLLEKLFDRQRRSLTEQDVDEILSGLSIKDLFNRLKDAVLSKIDKEKLKDKVHELFGKGNELADQLLKIINEKGDAYKQKVLDFIDRYLGNNERRSIKDMWEKVKDYFKDLQIDLKEKYMKFGEWVKDKLSKGLEKGKDRIENIRNIAKEFVEHTKGLSKDVAAEALEFLRPYKEDLGSLWDQVKETVKDVLNRNDDKRSIKDMWEKVKDYFKDLQIDLKEKYMKFGEWVKDKLSKGLEKGKDKIENIRNIAKEFVEHTKGLSKDVAAEALEFLRPYKEDLGSLWDQVKETVKDVLNRND